MKKMKRVCSENVDLIATVESMGTWQGVRRCKNGDCDIWEFNGILYQIPQHEKNEVETL